MNNKKKNILFAVLALALIIAMVIVYIIYSPKINEGRKTIIVQVDHLSMEDSSFEIDTKATYLSEALEDENLIKGEEGPYGIFVTTVDGETADAAREEWWGYTVNGEMAAYGVDEQVISDGDVYVFTLNEGYSLYN